MNKQQGIELWNAIYSYEEFGEGDGALNNPVAHYAVRVLNSEIATTLFYDHKGVIREKVRLFLLEWAEALTK